MVAIAKNIKVPELRFPEFSGEWERGTFDDFVDGFTSGSTPSRSIAEYFNGDIPWVNSGDLDYNIIHSTPQNITEKAVIDTNLKIHQPGTFLMAITGLEAAGTRGSCAILGVNATTNQSCMALHVRGGKDVRFFYQYYLSVGQRYAFRYCQGTKQQSYNGQLVRKLPIAFPNKPTEQQKIAEFLTAVDEKIGKLKRKKELLEDYKKGAMQKLFSQEIRFKDDQGNPYPDWEEKRLGEVFKRVNTKNQIQNDNVMTISGQHGLINQVEYFNKSVSSKDTSHYTFLQRGQFAYNKSYSKGYPMGAIKRLIRYAAGIVSPLYICFELSSEGSGEFFEHFFETGLLNKWIQRIAQEGARNHGLLNVSISEFFTDLPIPVPSLPEQQKIAEFLTGIDDKIKAVANQIDKAAEFKKGLLQKMFV